MLKPFALIAALLTGPALADGGVTVPLPDIPQMSLDDTQDLLRALVVANVVSQNCEGFIATDAEWALLTGSADLLAERLDLGIVRYDTQYYDPAFALLDKADTCETEGPSVQPLIQRLIGWGGSLTPED